MSVTKPMEDYLATIYRNLSDSGRVTTGEVAKAMGVSSASATYMFKKLSADNLVEYEGYMGVSLTEAGRRIALRSIRAHRLTECFLVDLLGFPWDEVDDLAHDMDNTLPEAVIDRFDEILDYPKTCPHGHPIPTKDGTIEDLVVRLLRELDEGDGGIIASIEDDDPKLLRFLGAMSLRPGKHLAVVAKNPLDGTMIIKTETAETMIGERIIDAITLQANEPKEPVREV